MGTALADNYNSLDENTEWDSRLHSDFLSEYLGFFATITSGIWGSNGKTSELRECVSLCLSVPPCASLCLPVPLCVSLTP